MLNRTKTLSVAFALMLAGSAQAQMLEGTVSAVDAGGQLQIALPANTQVPVGDGVQVLADIPGLGPVAIANQWKVTNISGGTITATPEGALTGTPQVGYIARVQPQNTAAIAVDPIPQPIVPMAGQNLIEGHSAPVPAEAMNLYLAARDLAHSTAPADLASAADLFRRAAAMGHPEAMSELGARLSFGHGISRDDNAALYWQMLAAEHGNSEAMLRVGLIDMSGRGAPMDQAAAAQWIEKAARQDNADAMFLLAMLFEDGVGVTQSMTEMVNWLEKAAQLGHDNAMFILGHIYQDGEDGVILEDIQKTERYWLAAAEAGHAGAMKSLAEFYDGTSNEKAEKWMAAARAAPALPEYTQDLRCLSQWECYLPETAGVQPETVPSVPPAESTDPERTVRVTYVVQDCDRYAAAPRDTDRPDPDMAVEFRDLDAQRVISECLDDINAWPDTRRFYAQIARGYYKNGMFREAFESAQIGADLGSGQAMGFVGIMHKLGNPVPKDADKALEWFEKGAHDGNITCMHFAAGMHLNSEGVPYNPQAAAAWFQNAADAGSPNANANLGILYDKGEGVPFNAEEAAANLMIGLAMGDTLAKEQLLKNSHNLKQETRIAIQRILSRDGLYDGAFDGQYGPQTLNALQAKIMN